MILLQINMEPTEQFHGWAVQFEGTSYIRLGLVRSETHGL